MTDKFLALSLAAFKDQTLTAIENCIDVKSYDHLKNIIKAFRDENSDCTVELRLDKITITTPQSEDDDGEDVELIAKYTWGNPTINFLTLEDMFNIFTMHDDAVE